MSFTVGPQNLYIGRGVVSVLTTAPNIDFWQPGTAYALGDMVLNFTAAPTGNDLPLNVYQCTTAGTSGTTTGPTQTGTGLVDGAGSAVWESVALNDVGNCSKLTVTIESEVIKHKTSRSGANVQDASAEITRTGGMEATLEEYALENMAYVSYGTIVGASRPHRYGKMGNVARTNQIWQFVGDNAVGAAFQVIIPRAQINPPKEINFISDKYASFDLKGDLFGLPSDGYAFYYVAELD
jgi:hypothetical protein